MRWGKLLFWLGYFLLVVMLIIIIILAVIERIEKHEHQKWLQQQLKFEQSEILPKPSSGD
jgi:hypothetical protein